jgi:putative DNA primase/helicase
MMPGEAVSRVLSRLSGVKPTSNGWLAICPVHEDHTPSLHITERPEDLSVGLHCYAGCDSKAVVAALGLTFSDLYVDADKPTIVRTYDYRALDGTVLYQAVRYLPKDFRQRRPDGHGGCSPAIRCS